MAVDLAEFVQKPYERSAELRGVRAIAHRLRDHLNTPSAQALIKAVNLPGASSGMVQGTFQPFAAELGFKNESRGLFARYETGGLRPDYYRRLGKTGILLEVERGKTTINNMDMLDFWKAHLCETAHYLFLLVPMQLRQNEKPGARPVNEFERVKKRLCSFVVEPNYTNVRGLFLFGY